MLDNFDHVKRETAASIEPGAHMTEYQEACGFYFSQSYQQPSEDGEASVNLEIFNIGLISPDWGVGEEIF